jgi:hypothetical protein
MQVAFFLTLLSVSSHAQTEWKEFAPKDGSFTVLLPGPPNEFKKTVKTPDGAVEVVLFELPVSAGSAKYAIGYTEYPDTAIKPGTEDKRLDNARDGAVASTKGALVRQKILLLDNYPGRELLLRIDGKGAILMRLYAIKNRLYQLVVFGSEEFVGSKDAEKFLTSFKLAR